MSIEIYVLSDKQLSSIAEWQQAIDQQGTNLRLDTSRPFEALSGHLPAHRGDQHAGFECDHWPPSDIIESYPDIDFGHPWTKALAFRFGGDEFALWGAFAAAAAYARETSGVVFDPQEGEVFSPDKAAAMARDFEQSLPKAS